MCVYYFKESMVCMRKKFLYLLLTLGIIGLIFGIMNIFKDKEIYASHSYECFKIIDSIKVNDSAVSIKIESDDIPQLKVEYITSKNRTYSISDNDKTLVIKREQDTQENSEEDRFLKIFIPKNYKINLNINNKYGNINISNVKSDDLIITNNCGEMFFKNISSKNTVINNTCGDINLSDFVSSEINVSQTTGSSNFVNVKTNLLKVNNTCGSVDLKNLDSKNIDINTSTGSIDGSIIGNQNDYKISTKVNCGSCNLVNSDSGNRKLNLTTNIGSINIKFE